MSNWQKSSARQAPKSKAELRLMLTEAVRNTQPSRESNNLAKARKIAMTSADQASGATVPVR
jgi:hypothetical protein